MVNGPRPAKLAHASHASHGAAAGGDGTTPSRSPLLLQRQHTSIYSTCSTGTPVLVYGKIATPIAGAWSSEPWEESAVAAGLLVGLSGQLEAPTSGVHAPDGPADFAVDAATNTDETASVADTTAFTEKSSGRFVHPAATAEEAAPAAPSHLSVVYRHNPYSLQSRHEVYRCDCQDCLDAVVDGSDALFAPVVLSHHHDSSSAAPHGMMGERYQSDDFVATTTGYEYDDGCSTAAPPSLGGYGSNAYDTNESAAWHHGGAPQQPTAPASSNFMPPPPPPKITRGVMAESAEPSLDVDAAFYHIANRWYSKVAAVQENFVPADDQCPVPSEERPFDEWVVEAGKWWLRHFEHQQVKTSASSGLLRTGVAPLNARPVGFETHASISASYATHKQALRTGPRKEFGTSGLTESMLRGLGQAPSIPTPRSWRGDLPW